MNNKSISNITNESEINIENNDISETPKFKNKIEKIENTEDLINFDLNESCNTTTREIKEVKEISDLKKQECKSEIKTSELFNGIKITKANTFRIQTFFKPRKKDIKNDINKEQKSNNDKNTNGNELLQYNIFNQSRNYFKLNPKNVRKGIKSAKNKELSLFILKEISDNKSNNVPRSKKLYDDVIQETKETAQKKEQLDNIKEEENIDIENSNTKEINLQDYVYHPFNNCYAKLRKF
jgi:hypothetical protein